MEIIINLVHDTIMYNKESKHGTLKSGLFGAEDFSIHERAFTTTVDFEIDLGDRTSVWSYPCKFTDHGNRLVVTVE